jgi:hypothetical protein
MAPLPIHIKNITHIYEKSSKLKPPPTPDNGSKDPKDFVTISSEAKNMQTSEQAQNPAETGKTQVSEQTQDTVKKTIVETG